MKIKNIVLLFSILISGFSFSMNLESRKIEAAINNNNIERLRELINSGANVNCRIGDYNSTPLIRAAESSREEMVKLLLEKGASVNSQSKLLETALFPAIFEAKISGDLNIVKILLDAGADLNVKDDNGWTPLKKAWNQPEIIELLKNKMDEYKNEVYNAIQENNLFKFRKNLSKFGSVCFKDAYGNNLLHKAVLLKNKYYFGLILSIKPELITKKNKLGQTPLELAAGQDQDTFNILKSFKF